MLRLFNSMSRKVEVFALRDTRNVQMSNRRPALRLLLLGSGPRLVGAALIVAVLWAGFFWATLSPGTL